MGLYIAGFAALLILLAWRGTVSMFFGSIATVFEQYEGMFYWAILSVVIGIAASNETTHDIAIALAAIVVLGLLINKRGTIDKIMRQVNP